MLKIKLKSYGKINLCLDIISKRADGYHNIQSIMQSLDLADELEITKSDKIQIECDHPLVPNNEENIAYKAARAILVDAGLNTGAKIKITKKIPVAAGLGGGSSNAAAVLHGINILYQLNYPLSKLIEIGSKIGADVPFCLVGGTVLAAGIGEKITIIKPLEPSYVVLVKPDQGVSTKEIYQKVNLNNLQNRPDIKKAILAIGNKDLGGLVEAMGNVLEPITSNLIPDILAIKTRMLELGADGSQMCGSGPTVYAICSSKDQGQNIFSHFQGLYSEVYFCKTIFLKGAYLCR